MRLPRKRYWTFCCRLGSLFKSTHCELERGATAAQRGCSTNILHPREFTSVHVGLCSTSFFRNLYSSHPSCTSLTLPHSALSAKLYPTTRTTTQFYLPTSRPFSTNSTSVSPPPTPSTQGHCLPSTHTDSESDITIPEPPNNCCMSGCANCVWITYAQELAQIYKDSGRAAESVMNAIDDPSLKVFLNLELREKLSGDEDSADH